jgi:hypothetical protein
MGEQTTFQFSIDGRTIAAQPRPEDQSTLDELLRRGADVKVSQSDKDTEGHGLAGDEIEVDVEGHAMTLRLPNTTDAQALRRALAVGALTATFAIGGFVAGTQVAAPAAPLTPPQAITITQAAPVDVNADAGLADGASQAASEEFHNAFKAGTYAAPVQVAPEQPQPKPFNRQGERPE